MPPGISFEEQIECKIKYEFECRLIRNENEKRKRERERRSRDPDIDFELKLAEIRRKAADGEFPDKLVDTSISQTMCDPNSYVRRYALSKYGFR